MSLFAWFLPFDLSGLGVPAGSYATAGIALGVTEALKLPHHVKVQTPSGEMKEIIVLGFTKCFQFRLQYISSVSENVNKKPQIFNFRKIKIEGNITDIYVFSRNQIVTSVSRELYHKIS